MILVHMLQTFVGLAEREGVEPWQNLMEPKFDSVGNYSPNENSVHQ